MLYKLAIVRRHRPWVWFVLVDSNVLLAYPNGVNMVTVPRTFIRLTHVCKTDTQSSPYGVIPGLAVSCHGSHATLTCCIIGAASVCQYSGCDLS